MKINGYYLCADCGTDCALYDCEEEGRKIILCHECLETRSEENE